MGSGCHGPVGERLSRRSDRGGGIPVLGMNGHGDYIVCEICEIGHFGSVFLSSCDVAG